MQKTTHAHSRLSDRLIGGVPAERLCYSVAEAARATGIGRTTLYGLIKDGRLRSSKIGKRRVVAVDQLQALIAKGA